MSAQQSSVGDHRVYEDGDQVKPIQFLHKLRDVPEIANPSVEELLQGGESRDGEGGPLQGGPAQLPPGPRLQGRALDCEQARAGIEAGERGRGRKEPRGEGVED